MFLDYKDENLDTAIQCVNKGQEGRESVEGKHQLSCDVYGNGSHEALELPALYVVFKMCPFLLEAIKDLYQFRWRLSYPLQRQISHQTN